MTLFHCEGWSKEAALDAWKNDKVAAMTEAGVDPSLDPGLSLVDLTPHLSPHTSPPHSPLTPHTTSPSPLLTLHLLPHLSPQTSPLPHLSSQTSPPHSPLTSHTLPSPSPLSSDFTLSLTSLLTLHPLPHLSPHTLPSPSPLHNPGASLLSLQLHRNAEVLHTVLTQHCVFVRACVHPCPTVTCVAGAV